MIADGAKNNAKVRAWYAKRDEVGVIRPRTVLMK